MRKKISLVLVTATTLPAGAEVVSPSETDTLRSIDIEEVVIVASPKETSTLRKQAVTATILGKQDLQDNLVHNLRGVSALAPNFYMPDYGSRITSATYIRGIGSRANTPVIGLYVDNIPYLEKSAYTFSFNDVERVDVLRGPQGTLYGRNTMGGLMRVFTADPLRTSGTTLSLGASTRNGGRRTALTTYLHPSSTLGLSVGGYYEGQDGFYKNISTGKKADTYNALGGKVRLAWQTTDRLRLDANINYEYSKENASPYVLTEDTLNTVSGGLNAISQNHQSTYRRHLLNAGFGLEWQTSDFVLSSLSSYQFVGDRLFMDQDFTSLDLFTLAQKQRAHSLTEELVLRSKAGRRWQWTTGAFLGYEQNHTTCPIDFAQGGMDYLNANFSALSARGIGLSFTDAGIRFVSDFRTPTFNAALYHQSTIHELFLRGLSLTVGLRLDYDYHRLDFTSGTSVPVNYAFSYAAFGFSTHLQADPSMGGVTSDHSWQLLPKVALQYDLPQAKGNVYTSVSKGYRSGGYNIQSYSDLSQTLLTRQMMLGVGTASTEAINALSLPEATKQAALAGMTRMLTAMTPAEPAISAMHYSPEISWNYEVGTHLNFFGKRMQVDIAFFLTDTKDLQLTRFSKSGLGREVVNAGKARSYGTELSLRGLFFNDRLSLTGSYGYTHAEFTDYLYKEATATTEAIRYDGHRIPFAPKHTLFLAADYRQPLRGSWLKALSCGVNLSGAGSIYWNEANSFKEDFYALLGAHLGVELGDRLALNFWGKNLTKTVYRNFSFYSMKRQFSQFGTPRHFGVDLTLRF